MNVGMVFAIIFAVIVMGVVLIFGSQQIVNIICLGNEAQTGKAIKDLETSVKNLYGQAQGSTNVFDLNLPSDSRFCFINSSDPSARPGADWNPDPVIQTMIKNNGYNLWYSHCTGKSGYVINHLMIPSNKNFCVKSGSELYLENKGFWVSIQKI